MVKCLSSREATECLDRVFHALAGFAHAREVIGFPAYDEEEKKYATT